MCYAERRPHERSRVLTSSFVSMIWHSFFTIVLLFKFMFDSLRL